MSKRLYSLNGNRQKLDGGAMFGNAPKALWERWAAPDDRNRIDLSCRTLLIEDAGRLLLLETGVGAFFEPKMKDRFGVVEEEHILLKNLDQVGFSHDDIDIIVLSHLHFDHAGGLLTAHIDGEECQLLFPNARYIVGKEAWQRANQPHARDKASFLPRLNALLVESGRLEIVEGETSETLGPDYRFHVSHGHTPGMLLTEVNTVDGPIVFGGDLVPGTPWVHQAITMGYDRFPELLIDEKTALLTDLAERDGAIFFTHDPIVAMAKISTDERGRFVPVETIRELHGVSA